MPSTRQDFQFLEKIGSGSYGEVFKVRRINDGKYYVIKQISIEDLSPKEQMDALNEIAILSRAEHGNVISYYDSFLCSENHKLNIVMEYASNGSLFEFLKKQNGKLLQENVIWKLFIQVTSALNYLHNLKILHRDIKSLNIFIDGNGNAKIGDFGVSKVLSSSREFANTIIGSYYYLSPEICEGLPYDERSDIWSLGCVLYEMCCLKHPFDSSNQGALVLKILTGKYTPISSTYSPELAQMVKNCLNTKVKSRPTTMQILNNSVVVKKAKELGIQIDALRTPSSPITPSTVNIELGSPQPAKNKNRAPQAIRPSSKYNNRSVVRTNTPSSIPVKKVVVSNELKFEIVNRELNNSIQEVRQLPKIPMESKTPKKDPNLTVYCKKNSQPIIEAVSRCESSESHVRKQPVNEIESLKAKCLVKISDSTLSELITFFKDSIEKDTPQEDYNDFVSKCVGNNVDIIQNIYKIIYLESLKE